MKKFVFSAILVFLAAFIFAQTADDYDKILKGDFSAVSGYYINEYSGRRERHFLQQNGRTEEYNGYQAGSFSKTEGAYKWTVLGRQEGYTIMLFPVGVEIKGIDTDKSRVRIYFTYDNHNPRIEDILYKETTFPATHIVTEDIPAHNGIIKKGSKVVIQHTYQKNSETWALIYAIDGVWENCSMEYLEEIKE